MRSVGRASVAVTFVFAAAGAPYAYGTRVVSMV
jgi:hypothetical protein